MNRQRNNRPNLQLELKKRNLATLIQATFPEVLTDLTNFSFWHPRVNHLLNSILRNLNSQSQSVFPLPEGYSGSKESIFQATSMLLADFKNHISPIPASIMWIVLKTIPFSDAFNHIHDLFTFLCNLKISFSNQTAIHGEFIRLNYPTLNLRNDREKRLKALENKVEKLSEEKQKLTTECNEKTAKTAEHKEEVEGKTQRNAEFNDCFVRAILHYSDFANNNQGESF